MINVSMELFFARSSSTMELLGVHPVDVEVVDDMERIMEILASMWSYGEAEVSTSQVFRLKQ